MTTRDRMVLIVISVLAVLAAGWILVVSPERQQASKLEAQVSSAKSELSSAEGQLDNARQAQSQYASAYSSIVSLGKAVPPGQEVPSLIYELSQATRQKHVEFTSITNGSSASGTGKTASPTATAAASTFSQMPFTFVFGGSFFDLEQLFHRLDGFATTTTSGGVQVSGRLLTVQSIKLSPASAEAAAKSSGPPELTGTITATAYQLPTGQSLTGPASATTTGATPASATPTTSTAPAPAVARVTP